MRRIATTMAGALLVSGLLVPTRAVEVPTCFGRAATILGTKGDDFLEKDGTGLDVWVGLAGNDYMDWEDYSGRDLMCGNSGDDEFKPFGQDDKVSGGSGRDTIHAGDGSDKLFGGVGSDVLYNMLSGSPYLADGMRDVLDGGAGTDTCVVEFDASTNEAIDTWRNCEHLVEVSE